jgi:signal recognition particle receptor subunit beta
MVELNHRERTIKVKVVYYGPPVGGKTTNIQVLHQHALATRRGELVSITSAQDRTILFDLLPLRTSGFRGFDLRLQVLAVPGQAMYAATRRLILKGADSVVFVANSAADRWEENIQSFREMTQNLIAHQLDPQSLPLVLQYNKRDLPELTPVEFMDRALNARKVDSIVAVAVRGEGVLETFSRVLTRTMQDLSSRYQIVETGKGRTITQWTQETIVGMFGTTSFAIEPNPLAEPPRPIPAPEPLTMEAESTAPGEAPAAPEPPVRRTVRVALPDEAVRRASLGPDARANETLVESYAQASQQLSQQLAELREERDTARRRIEDVQHALGAAQQVLAGEPLDPTLRSILGRMAEAVGASHATFLVPEGERTYRVAAILGLVRDPLLSITGGTRHFLDRFRQESEPRLLETHDNLDLAEALERADVALAALLSVPVRTPRGLQGVALLYYSTDAPPPGPAALGHVAVVSKVLSSSLELARALETVRAAERNLQMALAGTASLRGLDDVLSLLEELRDRLGAMRRKPDAPMWFLTEFAEFAPALAGALTTTRSLLAFSRGQIQKEPVPVRDLVADLRAPALSVHVDPAVTSVAGDPVLLRLGLAALVDHARGADQAQGRVELQAVLEGGRVRISVGGAEGSSPSGDGSRGSEAELDLVRRIAELHGGTLTLEGIGTLGTRYTVSLVPA